jgi:hypothetical protein
LGRQKIPTYQPNSDDKEPGDDSYLKGKIVSAHACKGLESPVLAISFDSAAKWLHNGYDDFDLAPPYHVAMTRCKERLTLLQHHESPDLRAFQNVGLERMAEIFNLESYDADHIETPSSTIAHRRDQVHRHAHVDVHPGSGRYSRRPKIRIRPVL